MSKLASRILITGFTFVVGVAVVTGWIYLREWDEVEIASSNVFPEPQKVEVTEQLKPWEPIFFQLIDKVTKIGGLEPLREAKLSGDDIEIRIWRGFGLGDLEAVTFRRVNNQWSAIHLKADHFIEPRRVEGKVLNAPKSGWDSFWTNLSEQGLTKLRDPYETDCEDGGVDGTGYVVEINQGGTYRNFRMREEGHCPGARQMEQIGDFVGMEFDSGSEECRTTEWFACAKRRKSRR